ncbi:Dymeclin [Entophlyctis helioformis]|nr:Dymeclin [Entophlyctis helioformis]
MKTWLCRSLLQRVFDAVCAKRGHVQGIASCDKSIMLMLVITGQGAHMYANLFRDALAMIVDSGSAPPVETGILGDLAMDSNPLQLSFRDVYQAIVKRLDKDETCLFLYLLLLKNREFKIYVLSRTDPESLMVPLLRIVYEAVERKTSYSLLYILLTILLILSQDDVYNENSQKVAISPPAWFTERIIRSVTLGGLAVLVLVRAVQANMSRHKDVYFHTTSLAILANMSSTIVGMPGVVAQRLINLYESVAKKYQRLAKRMADAGEEESPTLASDAATDTHSHHGDHEHHDTGDLDAEMSICSDVLALLLEIINSVLTHTLKSNPQLLYTLLHRRDMFTQFRMHGRFGELVENIDTVIGHFHARLVEADLKTPSSDDILRLIDTTAKRWTPARLKVFADVKFQYEEETEYQRFFVPYVWSLIYQHSLIFWSPNRAQLLCEIDPDFPVADFTVPL